MKYIDITITESGESKIEASGFKGGACSSHVDAFAQGSTIKEGSRKLKPEFHQKETAKDKVKAGN